jgi:hypothetical protein
VHLALSGLLALLIGCGASSDISAGVNKASLAHHQRVAPAVKSNRARVTLQRAGQLIDVSCDASFQDVALCAGEFDALFCDGGSWYSVDCGQVQPGSYCVFTHGTIDCQPRTCHPLCASPHQCVRGEDEVLRCI